MKNIITSLLIGTTICSPLVHSHHQLDLEEALTERQPLTQEPAEIYEYDEEEEEENQFMKCKAFFLLCVLGGIVYRYNSINEPTSWSLPSNNYSFQYSYNIHEILPNIKINIFNITPSLPNFQPMPITNYTHKDIDNQ